MGTRARKPIAHQSNLFFDVECYGFTPTKATPGDQLTIELQAFNNTGQAAHNVIQAVLVDPATNNAIDRATILETDLTATQDNGPSKTGRLTRTVTVPPFDGDVDVIVTPISATPR